MESIIGSTHLQRINRERAASQLNSDLDDIIERARVRSGAPGVSAAVYYNHNCSLSRDSSCVDPCSSPATLDTKISALSQPNVDSSHGVPALALLRAKHSLGGDVIYEGACGWANLELSVPMHPSHRLCIASISKPITALLLARLRQAGLFSFDERLSPLMVDSGYWSHMSAQYAEYYHLAAKNTIPTDHGPTLLRPAPVSLEPPAVLDEITPRQLLRHTAGIRGYKSDEFYSTVPYPSVFASILPFIYDKPLHGPEKGLLYSTHGYTLAGAVAEAVAYRAVGRALGNTSASASSTVFGTTSISRDGAALHDIPPPSFPTLLSMLITGPLNLPHLSVAGTSEVVPKRATEYQRLGTRLAPAPAINQSNRWGGGGLVADVSSIALIGGAIVSANDTSREFFLQPQILQEMLEPSIRTPGSSIEDPKSEKFPGISKIPEVTGWAQSQASRDLTNIGMGLMNFRPSAHAMPSKFPHIGYTHIAEHAHALSGPLAGHSGEGIGTSAYMLVAPEEGICVALLANQNNSGAVLEEAALEMAAAFKNSI